LGLIAIAVLITLILEQKPVSLNDTAFSEFAKDYVAKDKVEKLNFNDRLTVAYLKRNYNDVVEKTEDNDQNSALIFPNSRLKNTLFLFAPNFNNFNDKMTKLQDQLGIEKEKHIPV